MFCLDLHRSAEATAAIQVNHCRCKVAGEAA
jgi:hypothetical protein